MNALVFRMRPISIARANYLCQIQFDKLDAIITDDVNLIAYTLRNTGGP